MSYISHFQCYFNMKLILFLILGFTVLLGQEYVVVIAKSCVKDTNINIQQVYLKKQRRLDGCHITPLNLSAQSSIRKEFVHHIIGMSDSHWNRYWDEMHFKGVRAPHVVTSNEAMRSYIERMPGAIGYIPKSLLSQKMYVLKHFEAR